MATLASEEFYIIIPAEATNEIPNPSMEIDGTGWTAYGGATSITTVTTYQRRGNRSLEVTTVTGAETGTYYGSMTEVSGVARTFSADVYSPTAGLPMRIQIRTSANVVLAETTFTTNGYWQRVTVTYTGTASVSTRRLFVVRDSVASTAKFYVDGAYYSTVNGTYLDGDMKGFVKGKTEYRWNGTPNASTSWRSGQTRSGGTLLRIKDYARILLTLGLGMAPITNIAQPLTVDYSSYQTTRVNNREFVLALAFSGLTPGAMQDNRQALIAAVQPDRTAYKQPLVIRYQGLDSSGGDASEPVDIIAHYVDGLDNQPGVGMEKAAMRFVSYLPFIQKAGDSGTTLGFSTTVSSFGDIGYRDTDGTWKAMGTGVTGGSQVRSIVVGPDGSVYAGGSFTEMGGVANTAGIAKWNGTSWSALGTGVDNNGVSALAIGPDGSLYAAGSFTKMSGVANTAYIAKWDGTSWSALGTGANASVYTLSFGPDGSLYAGGGFTLAGGVANTVHIAMWDGTAWSALGTGTNGTSGVTDSAIGLDGSLYIGGDFTLAGGVADTVYIAKWNGTAWSALGTGMDNEVDALAVGPDGSLYAGGAFTLAGGISAPHIAKWNGTAWSPLGGGNLSSDAGALHFSDDGDLYVGGIFRSIGGVNLPDRCAVYHENIWTPFDVDVQDVSAVIYTLATDRSGRLYMGGSWSGTDALSATVIVSSVSGVRAYPVVKFTGPGAIWQVKNYTTGKSIYFNNLVLLSGETAILNLMPGKISFTSSFRGNLMSYILNGSDFDWFLLSGSNNVSAFMTGTTAASGIKMSWQDLYWSIDGAKR